MEIPPILHPMWRKLVTGEATYEFSFLAAKILLTRVKIRAKYSDDPQIIEEGIEQLRGLFIRLKHIPNVHRDLQTLFDGGT